MADNDYEGILRMFAGPTEEEKREAKRMAFMHAGLGVLAANKPGPYPQSLGGLLGQGGLQGFGAYQGALKEQRDERRAGGLAALQALQIQKQMEQQKALQALVSPPGAPQMAGAPEPTPPGMSAGTSTAAFGVPDFMTKDVPQPAAPAPGGFQPIPVDRLAKAAAGGVNIDPFLKLNAEARPDVIHVDAGNTIRLIDKKTLKVVGEIPKGAAPGSVPYEASDITSKAYRDFLLSKSTASASKNITNVNAYTPASEEAQRDFIKSTRATYDQLKQAPVALDSIDKAKALIPGARGFIGPGGEGLLGAAKFLNNRLGMSIDTEGIKDAEELRTRIFFNIMDNLKKMDAQPSQQQQKIMQEALGNLGTDPGALPRVLDAFGDAIKGKVALHNNEVQGAIQRGVKFPYDPLITIGGGGPKVKRYNPATQRIE